MRKTSMIHFIDDISITGLTLCKLESSKVRYTFLSELHSKQSDTSHICPECLQKYRENKIIDAIYDE